MKPLKRNSLYYIKLFALVVVLGIICGCVGALFHECIALATDFRKSCVPVLFLLPFGGLVSVFIYKKLRVTGVGTMDVLKSINEKRPFPYRVAPAIFIGSVLTHIFGASCGKEGAALQLGGSVAAVISKLFHIKDKETKMLTVCGMGALFSSVFGTPLGAAVFAVEVTGLRKSNIKERLKWLLPCLISSLCAWGISSLCGTNAERFTILQVPSISLDSLFKSIILALASAAVACLFYKSLHLSEHMALSLIKNGYIRIFIGGIIVIALTIISGSIAFNGGGIEIVESIFKGNEAPFSGFLYKIIFTCVSVCAGYKGGEIVPTLFVGATLGSALADILSVDSTFAAALGMAGLFAGMTKCPVASLLISMEMFGVKSAVYFILTVVIATFLSGKGSLYIKEKK